MTTPFRLREPEPLTAYPPALAAFADHLADRDVTDIFVNGDSGLFIDRGDGADRDERWRASEREVRELAIALIAAGGRHIDDAHPCVDVRIHGGIRVHAVLSPVAARGTSISIRVPRWSRPELTDLDAGGMFPPGVLPVLRDAVERRANFLVSGAAGAGKTTLLSALLAEAPISERIITIEDVAEIRLEHPHHVALEARQVNIEGAGGIDLPRLVREALRMKPDRLVIGECRGAEVRELLTALNTGHDGGAGTVHANGLGDVATRLEALGALAGLDDRALARQVVSAIEMIVHVECDAAGVRRVAGLGRFTLDAAGRLAVEPRVVEEPRSAADPARERDDHAVSAESSASAPPGERAGLPPGEAGRPSPASPAPAHDDDPFDVIVRGFSDDTVAARRRGDSAPEDRSSGVAPSPRRARFVPTPPRDGVGDAAA